MIWLWTRYQETPALKRWASSPSLTPCDSLSLCRTHLAFLHATTLFEAPMVRFDSPGLARQAFPLLLRHFQVIGGPVFHVPVFGNRPKHSDKSIGFLGYRHGGQGQVPRFGVTRRLDRNWLSQNPLIPDGFQILQAGIPTVEQHPTGLKAPPLRPPASAGSGRSWSDRSGDGHRLGNRRVFRILSVAGSEVLLEGLWLPPLP